MSKARTLADFISDGSEFADGQISVAEVVGAAPLASPTFTGTVTSTGNIALGDDDELVLGSNRMRLYYSASNNYTVLDSNGTSGFVFDGVNNLSVNIGGSLSGAFTANGVSLYSGGAEKLQVYGSGTIALDDIKVNDDVKIGFGQFHTDLELYHDSATSTNKLVGDVVQTGKLTTDATDLSALAATISDTAVDIFVYDTSKDSDGGAWRKRTQHTSWYNEAASSIRGSRKEFPAVAVIVAESNQVTIYDGDDPDLPMWMVFNGTYDANLQDNYLLMWSGTGNNISCTTMSNGKLGVGVTTGGGLISIDFISEFVRYYRDLSSSFTGAIYSGTIADRNTTTHTYVGDYNEFAIVNTIVNDVAMTVLPNAPLDAATGLPVPTIAVGTNGGMSVIKDDGTVVDITESSNSTNNTANVEFLDNNKLVFRADGDTSYKWSGRLDIPSSTRTYSYLDEGTMLYVMYGGAASSSRLMLTPPYSGDSSTATTAYASYKNNVVAGTIKGFGQGTTDPTQNDVVNTNLVNYTSSSYNTGWMNGDIKLATLSDTDDTDVTGSELVTNGTFASDTSGWTAYNDGTLSVVSGALRVTPDADGSGAQQSIATVSGKKYVLSGEFTVSGGQGRISVETSGGSTITNSGNVTSFLGSLTFTAGSATTVVKLNSNGGTSYTDFDNISVRLAEEDRSVNGNGLQVFGTVTKSAVATGADLVAYSGFSTSNYLAQPYNSDIDVGTGDFSIAIWAKANAFNTFNALFAHWRASVTDSTQFSLETVGSKMYFYVVDSGNYSFAGGNTTLSTGLWYQFIVTRRSGLITLYINGVPESTTDAYAGDLTARTDPLTIGALWSSTGPSGGVSGAWNGSLALARFSATAPSPEQIKKIYEDEKVLFQENAQATLYGDSDAVTALAYDDTTELLHVGTSAGRSVFQGLRRVDNTTTAVGAAISASNGLVADE